MSSSPSVADAMPMTEPAELICQLIRPLLLKCALAYPHRPSKVGRSYMYTAAIIP